MGTPKADLRIGNETFLGRIAGVAGEVFDEVLAVQRPGGEAAAGVATLFERPHDGAGPVFGLARALEDAGENPFWVLGVDYPLITAPLLRFLRAEFVARTAEIVLPAWEGKPQYLCAGYRPSIAKHVDDVLRMPRPDLRSVVERSAVITIPEEGLRTQFGSDALANVNDPDEYETLRKKHEKVT
jgi:molybdopterin-guanine dinucleotide biosynthesis protein A